MSAAEIEAIRQFLADTDFSVGTIVERRASMAAATAGMQPPPGVDVEPTRLAGRPAEWLVPNGASRDAAVLYLHGGAYCMGSLDSHRGLAGRIALASGVPVCTLDYRLAPEDPFPAGLEDATAAYRALLAGGTAAARLAVAGDSAGGGLVVATLLALRDAGVPPPAAAVCLSPWVDLTQSGASYDTVGDDDPMISREEADECAAAYLAGNDPQDPGASPLFADLSGLPPLRLEVGEVEVLLDDSLRLTDRARAAGVEVDLVRWPGMIHVFQAFPAELLAESTTSIAGIGAYLRGRLAAAGG